MIRLVPRTQFGFWPTVFPLLIALALTIVVGFLVMLAMSEKPLSDIWTLLTFPWQARTASVQWGFVLQKTSYLAVIAVGLSIGFRANVWNIGAEGQFAFGSIAAFAGYLICGMPDTVWFLPVMLAFGVLGGVQLWRRDGDFIRRELGGWFFVWWIQTATQAQPRRWAQPRMMLRTREFRQAKNHPPSSRRMKPPSRRQS